MQLCPGLKVKKKWLEAMRGVHGPVKSTEVRKYLPYRKFRPKGSEVYIGQRICLVACGEVWGSARLLSVDTYTLETLAADPEHRLDAFEGAAEEASARLLAGETLYAWRLRDFHWFPEDCRPLSGSNGVPEFCGQRHGQVWTSQDLPCGREPEMNAV